MVDTSSQNKDADIVIDLESEDLTYSQARSIRLKIEKDVLQLQNRVRMLQEEEARARKKITDTRKKAQEIQQRIDQNDNDYRQKLLNAERSKLDEELSKKSLLESKMKSQLEGRTRVVAYEADKM